MRLSRTLKLGSNKTSATIPMGVAMAAKIAYAEANTIALPTTTLAAENKLLTTLENEGILAKLDFLYILATDGPKEFAYINVVNPGTKNCIEVGTPLFVSKKGTNRNGGNNGLQNDFRASTDGVNIQLNSNCIFGWAYDDPTISGTDQYLLGSRSSIDNSELNLKVIRKNADQVHSQNNIITNIQSSVGALTSGLYISDRQSSTNVKLFKGDTEIGTSSSLTATQLPNRPFGIGLANIGIYREGYDGHNSIIGAGDSIQNLAKITELNTAISTYMAEIA